MMNDKFAAVRNHEFKETDGINSVHSSLNRRYKFRTFVSKVSFFVGNPV